MTEKVSAATRERLLAAAERLLSTERYDDVSVRGICAEAGANPAAVHYHFGSKEALVTALLEDRLGPLWATRLAAVTARHGSVSAVVDAVIEPFVQLAGDPMGRLHLRLLAQYVLGRHATSWHQPWFRMDSWVGLLPELSEHESRRRWMLAFDLIIMRFGGAGTNERAMSPQAVSALRDFVVAGLTVPAGGNR
ncbi:TetR/AcrR family transcriptional regulator [Nocardia sp. NBC_01730]|uniref:TetR/AcrR family transcriptional regulator n=1 Tax=Nocardia sp. NBC_01730 TaxID=2975998 RepID=UPI002E13283E|nr:TetR/AcrR family transcriptional regulator [Nocardia sp. NBC_01730]